MIGSQVSVQLGNSANVTTPAILLVGSAATAVTGGWGGTLLVDPRILAALLLPAAGLAVPWTIPGDPALCGFSIYVQSILADAGAPAGVASSPGLRLTLGN